MAKENKESSNIGKIFSNLLKGFIWFFSDDEQSLESVLKTPSPVRDYLLDGKRPCRTETDGRQCSFSFFKKESFSVEMIEMDDYSNREGQQLQSS